MAKFIVTTIVLMSLANLVQMQDQTGADSIPIQQGQAPKAGQSPADSLRQLPFGNSLLNLPQQIQGQMGRLPFLNNLQGGGNQQGSILSTLRDLPARGMQMLGNMFNGIRNIIPGLGRNANIPNPLNGMNLPNMPSMPDMPNLPNMPSIPNSLPNMPNLPNLSNLPLGDRLQQGTQTLSNAVSSLTNGIRGVIPGGASVPSGGR